MICVDYFDFSLVYPKNAIKYTNRIYMYIVQTIAETRAKKSKRKTLWVLRAIFTLYNITTASHKTVRWLRASLTYFTLAMGFVRVVCGQQTLLVFCCRNRKKLFDWNLLYFFQLKTFPCSERWADRAQCGLYITFTVVSLFGAYRRKGWLRLAQFSVDLLLCNQYSTSKQVSAV